MVNFSLRQRPYNSKNVKQNFSRVLWYNKQVINGLVGFQSLVLPTLRHSFVLYIILVNLNLESSKPDLFWINVVMSAWRKYEILTYLCHYVCISQCMKPNCAHTLDIRGKFLYISCWSINAITFAFPVFFRTRLHDNQASVIILKVSGQFVLCHFNRCNFNRSHS